jgi:hypothetical protein
LKVFIRKVKLINPSTQGKYYLMSKKIFVSHVVRILIPSILFCVPVMGFELDFKISAGYTYLDLQEVNTGLTSWAEWIKTEADNQKNWEYLAQNIHSLHSSILLEGEILLSFSRRLRISLGTGYLYGDLKENKAEVLVQRPTGVLSQVFPITASAYPVILSVYYFLPLNNRLYMYAKGGGGWAWAKYVQREGKKLESAINYNFTSVNRASATGAILLGGIGFMFETDVGLRFFVEGLIRKSQIQGFSGENEIEEQGTLYYFEEYIPDLNYWQVKNEIRTEKPTGSNIRAVSEAVVDFSGFSVTIGFIIRF